MTTLYHHSTLAAVSLSAGVTTLILPADGLRKNAMLYNAGTVEALLGDAGVTADNGMPMPATTEKWTLEGSVGAWYGTVQSTPTSIRVLTCQ